MSKSEFIVYSKENCPNCEKAVSLLQLYGRQFRVIKLGVDMTIDDFKKSFPGVRSAPFITQGTKEFSSIVRLGTHLKETK